MSWAARRSDAVLHRRRRGRWRPREARMTEGAARGADVSTSGPRRVHEAKGRNAPFVRVARWCISLPLNAPYLATARSLAKRGATAAQRCHAGCRRYMINFRVLKIAWISFDTPPSLALRRSPEPSPRRARLQAVATQGALSGAKCAVSPRSLAPLLPPAAPPPSRARARDPPPPTAWGRTSCCSLRSEQASTCRPGAGAHAP